MFGAIRAVASRSSGRMAFSTSTSRASDLSKLVLVGHLVRDPEVRMTKHEKEYVMYVVATMNYPPPPPSEERRNTSTFHRIVSFHEGTNKYLQNLKKGSKVYAEAAFELREPEEGADPTTPQGQRQILLRHEMIRVLNRPKNFDNGDESDKFKNENEESI